MTIGDKGLSDILNKRITPPMITAVKNQIARPTKKPVPMAFTEIFFDVFIFSLFYECELCYTLVMLPIEPRLKIIIEGSFLCILLVYALRSFYLRVQHLSAGIAVLLSIPLAVDVLWLHCIRSPQVWAALNVPFLAVVVGFCYVRIAKKSGHKLRRKLAILVTLLCRE